MTEESLGIKVKDLGLEDILYTSSELSTATQIKTEFDKFTDIAKLNIKVISKEDYEQLGDNKDMSAIYLLDDNDVYMEGCTIHELASGVLSGDAVNKAQLDECVSKQVIRDALATAETFESFKAALQAAL